ncbi:homeobox protein 5 isoform X3 [Episyrphus balteatus]|uniref:homeobox protein 5 isoform X3 n=1 Tax=Episyrphus balteatus TaxID=286459 RepID=UPI0024853CED|nr:homeobox protein 5 isoform X3 [Episyrphus balteatus]
MKSSKRDQSYAQKKSSSRKSDQKTGSLKLDRKSSRGMIYENEELRLRTININAEVERGQSDIRKLRRENEQLRREIWSLRDEYDRLNKRFKANKYLPDSISEHGQSESNSEDSDSCDTCRGEPDINEECLDDQHDCIRQRDSFPSLSSRHLQYDKGPLEESSLRGDSYSEHQKSSFTETPAPDSNDSNSLATATAAAVKQPRDNLHVNFDHLSIVSEENLSNSDGNLTQLPIGELNRQQAHQQLQQAHPSFYYDENFIEIDGARLSPSQCLGAMSLPSLAPLRPITPIEMVANQLNDLQSMVPPLSYFENIVQQHMGTTINSAAESNTSTNTGDTVIQTNGWDYNIQSPFLQRKFQSSSHSSASSNSTSTTMSLSHLNNPPNSSVPVPVRECKHQETSDTSTNNNGGGGGAYKNLKHFFSPIKPRLKLDTALAAAKAAGPSSSSASSIPPLAPVQYFERLHHHNCDPPDVYVTNALASPYYPQPMSGLSLPSVLVPASAIQQSCIEPIYATAQKKSHSSEQSLATAPESSKNSINLEQILNEIGTMSEDILQMQLEKSKSQEKLSTTDSQFLSNTTSYSATSTPLHTATTHTQTLPSLCGPNTNLSKDPSQKNRKPYRSEMNLLLSYNGTNPVIIPLAKNNNNNNNQTSGGGISTRSDGGATDRDVNSPSPPQLPTPMAPFPTNLMYLGFDRLNQSLADSGEILYPGARATATMAAYQCMSLPSPTTLDVITPQPQLPPLPMQPPSPPPPKPPSPPPVPPAPDGVEMLPDDNRLLHDVSGGILRLRGQQDALNPVLAISSPDLSTSPLATIAPLKRRIFSRQKDDGSSSQTTRSFDAADVNSIRNGNDSIASKQQPNQQQTDISLAEAVKNKLLLEGSSNEINSYESSSGSEATKRKSSRRVSIVCHEKKIEDKSAPDATDDQQHQLQQQQPLTAANTSVEKLDNIMPSMIVNLKHAHSTPNSPHSNRRRGGINTNSAISVNSGGSSTLHHHGHHHHHHHHHHSRKLSQESVAEARCPSVANSIVNSSQDNVLGAAAIASPSQHSTRYKCSRRHSEGTVSSVVGGGIPIAGSSGNRLSTSTAAGNHHHHHHHHQDSNQETGTSVSERNSGSLASSRDSSTSLSMRSQRRKISVSSHTGGKIPWCGCWGNGCL